MKLALLGAALGCVLADGPLAVAAEPARLKAEIVTKPPILVGQRVTIRVVLFTETIFSSAPAFEIPAIPGAVLMHVEDRPLLGTEEIDGTSYTTQTHELACFAMRPGRFAIPPFPVRFESPPMFGQKPVERRVTMPDLAVEAVLPKGAEGLQSLICTSELSLTENWPQRPGKTARVGDSFTRTVTMTAPGVPAMALPPLPLTGTSILTAYPKPAEVSDRTERGEFTGTRGETVTYVCERPGEATLPAIVIPWWNLDDGKLMQVTLPAVSFNVEAAATAPAAETASPPDHRRRRTARALALLAAAGAGVALWLSRERLVDAFRRRQKARAMSEAGRFHALLAACGRSDAAVAYNALLEWLDLRGDARSLATIEANLSDATRDRQVREGIADLEQAVLQKTSWNGKALHSALRRVDPLPAKGTHSDRTLPLLNPSMTPTTR